MTDDIKFTIDGIKDIKGVLPERNTSDSKNAHPANDSNFSMHPPLPKSAHEIGRGGALFCFTQLAQKIKTLESLYIKHFRGLFFCICLYQIRYREIHYYDKFDTMPKM